MDPNPPWVEQRIADALKDLQSSGSARIETPLGTLEFALSPEQEWLD
jgi:hypothetical protein